MHRFFVPSADATGSVVPVPEDEAAHLTRVLRLKAGDAIRVFDGRGREWNAVISQVGKGRTAVRVGDAVEPARESSVAIELAMAILKSDKMDDVVRDAVMLGVTRIIPMMTARTEITATAVARSGRVARWQRIAVSSAKQCGRAVVPQVNRASELREVVQWPAAGPRLMLVEPASNATSQRLRDVPQARHVTLVVGPEGGWAPEEIQAAAGAGIILATLGERTLRADAVPLVAMTAVRALWGDL